MRDAEDITIRELLAHRAGLFDYTSDPALLRGELDPRALIGIAGGKPRTDGYAYSSTNYLVLGLLLQRAGLAGLADMLERQILGPHGLTETSFRGTTAPRPDRACLGLARFEPDCGPVVGHTGNPQ